MTAASLAQGGRYASMSSLRIDVLVLEDIVSRRQAVKVRENDSCGPVCLLACSCDFCVVCRSGRMSGVWKLCTVLYEHSW